MPEQIAQAMRALNPPDPHEQAVMGVQQRYPRLLGNAPLALTSGTGPGHSETFQPWSEENPLPGKVNVQLRADKNEPEPAMEKSLFTEAMHYLGTRDPSGRPVNPAWFAAKQALAQGLSPGDMAAAQRLWIREVASGRENRSFEQFMQTSFLDGLIRGYLSPKTQGQEWIDRQREGRWSTTERKALDPLKGMLR